MHTGISYILTTSDCVFVKSLSAISSEQCDPQDPPGDAFYLQQLGILSGSFWTSSYSFRAKRSI